MRDRVWLLTGWFVTAASLAILALPTPCLASEEGKLRVLIVTGGHAFEEKAFYGMFDSIPDITCERAVYPEAGKILKPELADRFDVIVFYDMWAQGIPAEQQEAFVALLDRGIGVVALHHTMAAHAQWPEYAKIIGGKYHFKEREVDGKQLPKSTFAHGQVMDVSVADQEHPITRGLKDFTIHDEAYSQFDTDPKARVLLKTNHAKSDPELAWVKTYKRSRVFFLQLGHDHLAYEHPTYRELVARGIRWSAGRPADPQAAPVELFNGKDLTGWVQEGEARWEVQDGLLVGRQGENEAPGDLLTETSYDDFEVRLTYRIQWPANSGLWYRYQSARQAYQADILEYKNPFALSGSLYCTGKMFLAANTNAELIDREGWNTIVVRAVGDRHMVFLNGTKVADLRDDTSAKGRLGFQIHAGSQFNRMRIFVKQVSLREI
jgi:type 1 glutamine amidotransferase